MSKRQIERAAQKARATLRQHVSELHAHTREVSRYGGHGYAEGKQGKNGHPMPRSNANLQSGARLPQNVCEGFGADDPSETDYATVDKNG